MPHSWLCMYGMGYSGLQLEWSGMHSDPILMLSWTDAGAAKRVAVACDDGTLRLFSVEHGSPRLAYHRSLPRLGGRLLSVAWHPNGQSVVTGTAAGTLHAWHIAKSQELLRISVGATPILTHARLPVRTATAVLHIVWPEAPPPSLGNLWLPAQLLACCMLP